MRQLYLDLDGVIADFDGHYFSQFGIKLDRESEVANPEGMFDRINKHGSFFADLPMLPDGERLFNLACKLHPNPIIITGTPDSVENAEKHKTDWVHRHIHEFVSVICCKSSEKFKFCNPGDVLIDDWHKYRRRWELAGGIFILHRQTSDSINQAYGLFAESIDYDIT